MSEQLRAEEFLENTRLQEVKNYYIDTFDKVNKLESDLLTLANTVDNIDLSGYLPLTGETLTGALKFNLANQEIKLISNSVNYISNTTSNSIIYNNPSQYMKLGSGSSIDSSYLYSVKLNDYNYWYVNSNLTFAYYNPHLNYIMGAGPQISIYTNSGNDALQMSQANGRPFTLNMGYEKFNVNGGTQLSTDYYYHIYANHNGTKRIGLYTASYDKTNSKETYGEFLIYGDSNNKFLQYTGAKFNSTGTKVGEASLWLDDTFTVSGNRIFTNITYNYSLTLGGSLVIHGGVNHTTAANYDGSYNFNISTSEASIYDGNEYGFTFKYNPVTNKYGIEPKNKTGNNKKDFNIEGFHNIVNDKFTLSSDYDTSALSEPLTEDEISWINANSKDILALIMDIKRSGSGTDVVTRSEYNTLLNAYNDLAERLNQFLLNTGDISPTGNIVKTVSLNSITFSIDDQNADDDYTIDWGDGTTSLSGDGVDITHNYDETDTYTITVTPNNEDAKGTLTSLKDKTTEINVDTISIPDIDDDSTVEKITVDNNIMFQGSWGKPFVSNSTAITEIHVKENCLINFAFALTYDCPALTKVTLDAPVTNHDSNLFEYCPNLVEVHLGSSTMPTFAYGELFDTIPNGLVIYVPNDLVNDYKTALPTYASYIVGE